MKIGHRGGQIKPVFRVESHSPTTETLAIGPLCYIILSMYDYHVHTRLCNHAEGSMTAFIQHAVQRGFAEICFLDHLTITDSPRPMTMAVAEVPLYFQAVQRLKRTYSDQIAIKAGLEIEFNPQYTELFAQLVDDFAFDVIGSSIHQLDGIDIVSGPIGPDAAHADPAALAQRYLDYLDMMLAYDYFDIICHLDLLKKYGQNLGPHFEDRLTGILSRATARPLTVEVNTSGFDHPAAEAYPSPHILTALNDAGICVTIGSDAHRPEEIGRHFAPAFERVRAAGFSHLAVFEGRRPRQVPIPALPQPHQ
jgi:histidinol-phosphatase (PHP family)